MTADKVILAAGVLGTLKLMLKCRDELRTLPNLSPTLGQSVRTNSESLIGVNLPRAFGLASSGVAIAAGVNPNAHTKIEAVRYPAGSDLLGLIVTPLVEGQSIVRKVLMIVRVVVAEPVRWLRVWWPIGFARTTVILLVMQTLDNRLTMRWRRSWRHLWRRGLETDAGAGERPPVLIPEGITFARKMASLYGGTAGGSLADVANMKLHRSHSRRLPDG